MRDDAGKAGKEPRPAAATSPGAAEAAPACDLCGASMLSIHCKLLCPACGYTRDCSDP